MNLIDVKACVKFKNQVSIGHANFRTPASINIQKKQTAFCQKKNGIRSSQIGDFQVALQSLFSPQLKIHLTNKETLKLSTKANLLHITATSYAPFPSQQTSKTRQAPLQALRIRMQD